MENWLSGLFAGSESRKDQARGLAGADDGGDGGDWPPGQGRAAGDGRDTWPGGLGDGPGESDRYRPAPRLPDPMQAKGLWSLQALPGEPGYGPLNLREDVVVRMMYPSASDGLNGHEVLGRVMGPGFKLDASYDPPPGPEGLMREEADSLAHPVDLPPGVRSLHPALQVLWAMQSGRFTPRPGEMVVDESGVFGPRVSQALWGEEGSEPERRTTSRAEKSLATNAQDPESSSQLALGGRVEWPFPSQQPDNKNSEGQGKKGEASPPERPLGKIERSWQTMCQNPVQRKNHEQECRNKGY